MTDAKSVLLHYDDAFKRHHDGWAAPINWPKDMKLAKQLRERYTPEQLTALVDHFFVIEDAFIKQSGYTFGVFFACIGKIVVDYQKRLQPSARQQAIAAANDYHAHRQARIDGQTRH
jgi:hypothetical protein